MKAQTYELNRFWVVIYIAFPISIFILILTTTHQHFALKNVNQYSDTTNQLTIRINTYKRLDLLEIFLEYYRDCPYIAETQVVWSDQDEKPPYALYPKERYPNVFFEEHKINSLNNRFRPLRNVPTEAVLSIDDDLIIPCENLKEALAVWASNKLALVGFSARMNGYDTMTSQSRYFNWQFTWWSGVYSIVLTKASLLHRDYLVDFDENVGSDIIKHIDANRNCEDLAMSHLIAVKSKAAPVWMRTIIYEVSTGGISSGSSHFVDRSKCLDVLRASTGIDNPWVTGYQKVVFMSWQDSFRGLFISDGK